tara:strand:- start:23363 stop:23548 length:186 start_codon:yes stop_codon:yes gene_type:complete
MFEYLKRDESLDSVCIATPGKLTGAEVCRTSGDEERTNVPEAVVVTMYGVYTLKVGGLTCG